MATLDILLDNPMLTKHLRSRLRVNQTVPWVIVVVILCLFILWGGQAFNGLNNGSALSFVLGLEALILAIVGAQQVAGSVGGARESGVLDFHRVSPQPPVWLTLGCFLGAPVREYLLFAVTIPFAVFLAFLSPLGILGLLQVWVALFAAVWVLHAVALLASLVAKKPKGAGRGGLAGLMIFGIFFGRWAGLGLFYASSSLSSDPQSLPFFGVPVYWLLFVLIYAVPVIGFLFLACVRKMRSERAHVYTKAEAIGGMALCVVLGLGAFMGYPNGEVLQLVLIYALTFAGMIWVATVTPTQAEYVRGVRLASRDDQRRPSVWSDEGTSRFTTFACCALLFLGGTIASQTFTKSGDGPAQRMATSYSLAVAVFVLAYTGFGLQYFLFRLPRSGKTYFPLFLFLAWLVPIMAGSIAAGTDAPQIVSMSLLGLTPITGIAMSSFPDREFFGRIGDLGSNPARLTAYLPAIGFALVFHSLLVNYQRVIDRAVLKGAGMVQKKEKSPFDDLEDEVADKEPVEA